MCNLEKWYIDGLICKAEIKTLIQRANVWIPGRGREGGRNWEIGVDIYTLLILYIKQITNENVLVAPRTLLNALW